MVHLTVQLGLFFAILVQQMSWAAALAGGWLVAAASAVVGVGFWRGRCCGAAAGNTITGGRSPLIGATVGIIITVRSR